MQESCFFVLAYTRVRATALTDSSLRVLAIMQTRFNAAAEKAKTLSNADNDALLSLYKYFKQATVGDVNTERPGMMDFKGKAKWDAWNSVKGTSKETAQQEYVSLVEKLSGSTI